VEYLEADWKKDEGFKKSCEISKENDFYRQNYCGCEFSTRK
jgi:predicted adenine nucleotide alpha hydrolase (AANH) superfamily ATPase